MDSYACIGAHALETLLVLLVFMTSNKLLKVTIKVNFFVIESLRLFRVSQQIIFVNLFSGSKFSNWPHIFNWYYVAKAPCLSHKSPPCDMLAATAQLLQQTHNKLRMENLIFVDNAATQRRKLSSYLKIAELCIIISMRLSLYVIFTFPHIR